MHNLPLHADAAAVNDADLGKSALYRLIEIFLNDELDFAGLEGMEVDGVLDRDFVHQGRI